MIRIANEKVLFEDIIIGITTTLFRRGFRELSSSHSKWTYAFEKIAPFVRLEAEKRGLETTFYVQGYEEHGNSIEVDIALSNALEKKVLSIEEAHQNKFIISFVQEYIALPGDRQMYESLTNNFLDAFECS